MISGSSLAQQDQTELTHYVFPEFTNGIVLKKNGIKHETLLNYNSLTEEMVFEERGRKMAMAENEVILTDTVFIQDRKFIVLNGKFVEYLDHSTWVLYIEYKCRVKDPSMPSGYGGTSETSSTTVLSTFISNGTIYEMNLPGNFTAEPYFYYWLNQNGEASRFTNLRQLRKLYKGKEDLFKEYVKDNDVKYTNKQSVIRFIEYLESNQDL
jgi:hypothetical protein